MRIVFFGTSEVGLPVLDALFKAHEIVHIITSPDSKKGRHQESSPTPIAKYAQQHNIPVSKPEKVKNNPKIFELLNSLQADIFVVVAYGKILPINLLEIPPLKTINVHFSLLPKYRGPAPIQFAILNGETRTGTTIFILDELVDHGQILTAQAMDIAPNDTFTTLSNKLSIISAGLILTTLLEYQAGTITPQEQNHSMTSQTSIISRADGEVNFKESTAQEIYNRFRAFTPWPGIWVKYKNEPLKILSCSPDPNPTTNNLITCKDNTFLRIDSVQLPGKNPTTMKDFLNGHQDFNYLAK